MQECRHSEGAEAGKQGQGNPKKHDYLTAPTLPAHGEEGLWLRGAVNHRRISSLATPGANYGSSLLGCGKVPGRPVRAGPGTYEHRPSH